MREGMEMLAALHYIHPRIQNNIPLSNIGSPTIDLERRFKYNTLSYSLPTDTHFAACRD